MRKVLLFALLLILGLCAASPCLIGYQIKRNLYEVAAGFSAENNNLTVVVQDYKWGWLSSDATLEVRFQMPANMANDAPSGESKTITETLHSHILHGPLIHEPSGRFILALALIQTKAWLTGFDYTSSASDHSIGDMTTEVDFKNHWHSQYTQPTIAFELLKLAQIHMEPAQGNFDFTLSDNQLTAYSFSVDAKAMRVALLSSTELSELNVDGFHYENAFYKTPAGVWTGTTKMALPILTIKRKDNTQITVQEGQLDNTIGNSNATFYDFDLHAAVKNIQTATAVLPSLGPIQFAFSANHLSLEGVQALSAFFKTVHHQPMTDEERTTYFNLLPKLITPATLISGSLEAVTPDGKLQNEARFSWNANSTLPSNPQEMAQNANMSISLRVASAFVDKLIAAHDASTAASTPAPTTIETTAANSTPATPAAETATAAAAAATPASTKSEPSAAPPSFKATFDAWLEKGYVVKEENDYVVLVKHENGVTTVNGKTPTP